LESTGHKKVHVKLRQLDARKKKNCEVVVVILNGTAQLRERWLTCDAPTHNIIHGLSSANQTTLAAESVINNLIEINAAA